MKILAVDTATQRCSAALMIEDHIEERCQTAVRAHAELVLPMVEALLSAAGVSLAQLDALAFGRGPGGFTGVRVAAAMIQGLAFGVDRPTDRGTKKPRYSAKIRLWAAQEMGVVSNHIQPNRKANGLP